MEGPFQDMERHNKVPRGFLALFFGLIAWGVYYIAAYTPEISGWSQKQAFTREMEADKAKLLASAAAMTENPYEHDPKAVEEGRIIYREKCADCHGRKLEGGDGPPLSGHLRFGEEDKDMFRWVAEGRPGGMPAFLEELGRERIWKVVGYIDSVREYGKEP